MALKTSELNAKLFGKTNKRRVATPQEAQTAAKDKAQTKINNTFETDFIFPP